MSINVFAYGTLMFPEVARPLAGDLGSGQVAVVHDYRRYEATLRLRANFPYVEPSVGGQVDGRLYRGLTKDQLARLDWFEEEGSCYHRVLVEQLSIEEGGHLVPCSEAAWIYVVGPVLREAMDGYAAREGERHRRVPWDPECFQRKELGTYLRMVVFPSIEHEEYRRNFGESGDPEYAQRLKERYE